LFFSSFPKNKYGTIIYGVRHIDLYSLVSMGGTQIHEFIAMSAFDYTPVLSSRVTVLDNVVPFLQADLGYHDYGD